MGVKQPTWRQWSPWTIEQIGWRGADRFRAPRTAWILRPHKLMPLELVRCDLRDQTAFTHSSWLDDDVVATIFRVGSVPLSPGDLLCSTTGWVWQYAHDYECDDLPLGRPIPRRSYARFSATDVASVAIRCSRGLMLGRASWNMKRSFPGIVVVYRNLEQRRDWPLEGMASTRDQMLEWIASLTESHTPGDWVTFDGRVIASFAAERASA
jgi:hypothetical protein